MEQLSLPQLCFATAKAPVGARPFPEFAYFKALARPRLHIFTYFRGHLSGNLHRSVPGPGGRIIHHTWCKRRRRRRFEQVACQAELEAFRLSV